MTAVYSEVTGCDGLMRFIGKPLVSAALEGDKDRIVLTFADGSSWAAHVEGDCCSNSWIEHLEVPGDIAGAILTGVTNTDKVRTATKAELAEHECLDVYGVSFVTTKGEIILEFRNSSNGYYGGYLVEESR